MSIQYTAPGFEPMTFGHESPPITTRPGLPPKLVDNLIYDFFVFNHCKNAKKFYHRCLH